MSVSIASVILTTCGYVAIINDFLNYFECFELLVKLNSTVSRIFLYYIRFLYSCCFHATTVNIQIEIMRTILCIFMKTGLWFEWESEKSYHRMSNFLIFSFFFYFWFKPKAFKYTWASIWMFTVTFIISISINYE